MSDRLVFDALINELASAYPERDGKAMKIVDRDVVAATFDFADLRLAQADFVGELFLRPAACRSEGSDPPCQRAPYE